MKTNNVYGMGNAIVDIHLSIDESTLSDLRFPKGSSLVTNALEQEKLLAEMRNSGKTIGTSAGGSVGNSIATIAQLQGRSAFAGCVGDDSHGCFYRDEFENLKIHFGNPLIVNGTTGTAIVLVTPDGERTMSACLGVAGDLLPDHINRELVRKSDWLFLEGYLLGGGAQRKAAVLQGVEYAKGNGNRHRTNVALSLSSVSIASHQRDIIQQILGKTDLVISNKNEALAFTQKGSVELAIRELRSAVKNVVVTAGADGTFIHCEDVQEHVPVRKCKPVDTTGAGDAFAGGFLYGLTNGYSAVDSTRAANHRAAKIIMQYGARRTSGAREAWEEGLLTFA